MAVGTADLHRAIFTAWNDSGLTDIFVGMGGVAPVFRDSWAAPGQTKPYCVMMPMSSGTLPVGRSNGGGRRHIRDIPIEFVISAGEVDGDDRSAKEIAAYLGEQVMALFGGHPTQEGVTLKLANGKHLITQYQSDWGMRDEEDGVYTWHLSYIFKVDVPVV